MELWEQQLAAADRALQMEPSYAGAWNHRGDALAKLNRKEESLDALEKAIASDPGK